LVVADASTAPDLFDEFWALYPKKLKKADARKSWQTKVIKTKTPPDQVLAALRSHIVQWQTEREYPRFVPHPTTWLNGRRWHDEPQQAPLKAVSGGWQPYRNPADDAVWDEPLLPPNPREDQ
jgi:hypothetical protein